MAAASGMTNADLASQLDREALQAYTKSSVVNSEQSVEMVQALLIGAVWYQPPSRFAALKYYEYIHMASNMARSIGICARPAHARQTWFPTGASASTGRIHPAEDILNPDLSMSSLTSFDDLAKDTMECRRTFIACYGICAAISCSLRRPSMMRITTYTKGCLDYLESAPGAAPGDRVLSLWTRLVAISEEIREAFSYEDPSDMASTVEITTQRLITAFGRRLLAMQSEIWKAGNASCLHIMYQTIRLLLHELVLHLDHSPEDFKGPFHMGTTQPCETPGTLPVKALTESIVILTQSSHALLDIFANLSPKDACAMPVFSYIRISYAVFILAKLHLSASNKCSRLFSLIDVQSLHTIGTINRTILCVQGVIGEQVCRVPSIFIALLFKLRRWCQNPEIIEQMEEREDPREILRIESANAATRLVSDAITASNESSGVNGFGTPILVQPATLPISVRSPVLQSDSTRANVADDFLVPSVDTGTLRWEFGEGLLGLDDWADMTGDLETWPEVGHWQSVAENG